MFGFLRTTLALMVMVFHIFLGYFQLGTYAVFGFFIISGYLMTHIMHNTYGYNSKGRMSFAINRFLRLHPMYWLACLLTLALIFVLGESQITHFHKSMSVPQSLTRIVENIFMVFPSWIPGSIHPRLVPPTWAITIEMVFYALICLGLSKTYVRVKLWLVLSVLYVIYSFISGQVWAYRYFHVLAASLPFSIGALIYFIKKDNLMAGLLSKIKLSSLHLYVIMLVNCSIWMLIPKNSIGQYVEIGFYINLIICALLVLTLVKGGKIFNINRKWDKFIGDYSYPIYLLHLQSGLIASVLIFKTTVAFHRFSYNSMITFGLALIIVIVLSTALIFVVDKPIQKIRNKIKDSLKNL